jgi:hypothetical protein
LCRPSMLGTSSRSPRGAGWVAGNPKEIIIVTKESMLGPLQELANSVDPERIRVLTMPFANKRLQMAHGILHTTTDIIVFADDDAIWPPTLLLYVLEDQKTGGVGTSQRVQPVGDRMTVWEVLADDSEHRDFGLDAH